MEHFVSEYEHDDVYPASERVAREAEYAMNHEGFMILDVKTVRGWMCLDATRSYVRQGWTPPQSRTESISHSSPRSDHY